LSVNESAWQTCPEPERMLAFVGERSSERKLRLFACACCRAVGYPRRLVRRAIEVGERYADGLVTPAQRETACDAVLESSERDPEWEAPVYAVTERLTMRTAQEAALSAREESEDMGDLEKSDQACLLRDLFNPFRPPRIECAWRSWHGGTVADLARAAYEHRQLPSGHLDHDRLNILADAPEEADCTDAELQDHLRGARPHYRGCWALDGLLGRV
jgi:hypothetical protein